MTYDQLVALEGPVRYEHSGKGHLKMVDHAFPWSITETEFHYITAFILENNLKTGFEVATAFGISGLAAALGFAQTGGKLVTMDAYIEEHDNDPLIYKNSEQRTYADSDGFKSVQFLREHLNLTAHLVPVVGWSPTDVASTITTHFGTELLDYAFIDAGHFEDAIRRDILAIAPFMKAGSALVLHDIYDYFITQDILDLIVQLTGRHIEIVVPHPHGENLGIVQWLD